MLAIVAFLLAIALAILGQLTLDGAALPLAVPAMVFFLPAALLAGYALSRLPDAEPASPRAATTIRPRPWRIAGLALMVAAIAITGVAVNLLAQWGVDTRGIAGWGIGLLLMLAGAVIYGTLGREAAPSPATAGPDASAPASAADWQPPRWAELLIVLALLALAVFMRVYRIGEMPPGIFVDETNGAMDALAIHEGRNVSPFGTGWFETPSMYAYYLVGLFRLLGTTFTALKLASLLPGILTVAAFYPFARLLFGVPVAVASTVLLAVNRWHVNMSRWGWNEVAPPLFQVLALYFLIRGARTRRAWQFALGGVLLGLTMYTYLASRMVVAVVLAYVIWRSIVERGFLQRAWRGLIIFWVAYGLTFAPLASHYYRNPFAFLNRSQQVSITNDIERAGGSYAPLIENVRRHLLMFHVAGDRNPRHNLPGAPMLDPTTGILFLFGLGLALWRWQDHRRGLLVIWIPVTLAGGMLSVLNEGPQAYRTLAVVPAVCLLAGDGLVRGAALLATRARRDAAFAPTLRGGILAAGAVVLVLAGWQNYDTYFRRQANDATVYTAFSPAETQVAREVTAHLGQQTFYLSHRLYFYAPLRYLAYHPVTEGYGLENPPYRLFQGVEDLPFTEETAGDVVLLLDSHYADLLDIFTRFYPNTRSEFVMGRLGEPLYLRVTLPAGDVKAIQGLAATFTLPDGTTAERRDATIDRDWAATSDLGAVPTHAVWQGGIVFPRSGIYAFRAEGGLDIEIGGRAITGAAFFGKGLYTARVTQADPATGGQARLYWQPPDEPESLVPGRVLVAVDGWGGGLRGTYYSGDALQGAPVFDRLDPLILFAWPDPEPWFGPFSARWSGEMDAPQTGAYAFRVSSDDGARLYLDGQLIGEAWVPDRANEFNATVELAQGRHTIQIDFFQRGGAKALELWWAVPGQPLRPVPASALHPAAPGDMAFADPATAPSVETSPPQTSAPPTQASAPLPPLAARQVFTGTTVSHPWEIPLGSVEVSGDAFVIRVIPVPGFDGVYDYLRLVAGDGTEYRFEAEDTTHTTGDTYSNQHIADGHWWLQDTYGEFSGGLGLVALGEENAPVLTTRVPVPAGTYNVYLGSFTGDPANGPFAIAVDYE